MLRKDLKFVTLDYLRESNQLSVRAANCCGRSKLNTLYDIVSCFEENKSFLNANIKFAGTLTCEELDRFCKALIPKLERKNQSERNEEIMQTLNDLSEKEREIVFALTNLILESNSIIKRKKDIYGHFCSEKFFSDFYDKNCHLPMFWILEQYIRNDQSREIDILKSCFNILNNQQQYTSDELSARYGLTRERVRQIRKRVYLRTFEIADEIKEDSNSNIIKFKALLQNKDDWSYVIDIFEETNLLCQESPEVLNYLKEENCNITGEFALQIIGYIFRDKYSLFGGDVVSNKTRVFDNTFLVKREYSDIFDFQKMRDEFSNMLMDNETECLLDIQDYVANTQCWIKYDYNKTDFIISIIRDFLLYEFHLYSDEINGHIKLPANKEKKPSDVIYEILLRNRRPMHINEIFEEFKAILPEHKYTEAVQIRQYLQRHEAISFRNRNSVYTLKEWKHIKNGTIREAIVEYLTQKDIPQKVSDITEYILQYFPETNISSIRTSMFNDTLNRFTYFNDKYFGLKNKEYPQEYLLTEQQEDVRKTFEQRIFELELFVIEVGRFPFASSKNAEEDSLGRWWYRISNNKQKINDSQLSEVIRIKNKYINYETDKTSSDWNLNYNKLKCFILENRRAPTLKSDEKFLYGWYRRLKKSFENNELTEEQRQKYIYIFKLM